MGTRVGTFVKSNFWLIISLVMLGIAAYWSLTYVHNLMTSRSSATAPVATVQVVVPSTGIAAYTPLTSANLKTISLPVGAVPPGSFNTVNALQGQWSNEALAVGVPIVSSEVIAPKTANILAARIHPSDMAIDLPLAANNAVDGLIYPGDTISLFTTITESNGQQVMEDFMNGVKVLAVNGSMVPATTSTVGQSVTLILALPPKDVAMLLFMENKGSVQAALDAPNAHPTPPTPYGTLKWQHPIP